MKHIERTKVLAFIIDINSDSIKNEFELLCSELENYNLELLKKPKILFLSKCEMKEEKQFKKQDIPKVAFLEISSLKKVNLKKAKSMMVKNLNNVT